ncbi:MAG: FadR family transcriptional regulator [Ardenticatenaceae bacterium]|nr:FadR family transcriptional regulator [Ardenticatenaceae bacterium]
MTELDLLQPVQHVRLSDGAARQIKALIDQGVLRPGDKLPPERVLVKQLDVSRTALREALRVLETLNLIEVRRGRGAFVSTSGGARSDLSEKWAAWLSEHKQEVIYLHEIREGLDPKAAALAAERITEAEIDSLMEILARMEESIRDSDLKTAAQTDIEFHDAVNQASRNPFLIHLTDSINYALIEARYAMFWDRTRLRDSWEDHCRIVEALRKRDSSAAADAMLKHLLRTKEIVRQLNSGFAAADDAGAGT